MLKQVSQFFLVILLFGGLLACSTNQAPVVNAWTSNPGLASDYRVQKGDTIYSVAWAFGMDYRDLARYNHLHEPYELTVGQELRMSAKPTVTTKKVVVIPLAEVPPPVQIKPVAVVKPVVTAPVVVKTKAVPSHKNWLWPTKGKLVKTYSMAAGGNRGIDIAGKYNQPVLATAKGRVVYVGNSMPGYGNLIIIKHSENELSAYAFNKTIAVKEGQAIAAGQMIARMGKNSKGQAVLHFEVRENGKPVNPMLYVHSE